MSLQWKWLSPVVLLVLLAGSGAAVHAQSDPMVEAVQRALSERGFDPGKIDGTVGWRTRSALRLFQRSARLPDTGQISDATLAALGLELPGNIQAEADEDPPRTESAPDTEDAPTAETPSARPTMEPGTEAPETEPSRAEPAPMPGTDAPKTKTPSARPTTEPGAAAPKGETPRTEPAPERAARRELSFTILGWHHPQTGAEALARFNALGLPRDFKRGTGALFVPKAELVFVLQAGERIPDLDCDPGAGRLSVEFVFEPDGPVVFTPAAGGEYCRMGIGIAIEVGRTLEMRRVDWGDMQYPRGTVRITNQGLEYVRSST